MMTIAHCLLILFFGVCKSQFCTALTSDQAWSWIWICYKQKLISKNNKRENSKRIQHEYKKGDLVLLEKEANKCERDNEGPFEINEVFKNGTVRLQMGAVSDLINIRRLTPHYAQQQK